MTFTKWQSWHLNQVYGASITSEFRIEAQLNQGEGDSTVGGSSVNRKRMEGKLGTLGQLIFSGI